MNMCKPLMFFLVLLTPLLLGYQVAQGQCLPVVASDTDGTLCEGEDLTLTATITLPAGCTLGGGAPYLWTGPGTPGATGDPQITVGAAAAGDYTVSVVIAQDGTPGAPPCPCVGTQGASNVITVNPTPITPTIGAPDVEVCEGSDLQLLYTGPPVPGGVFAWTGPNGFSSSSQDPIIPNVPVANTGGYQLAITDVNGCTSPVTVPLEVVVNPLPEAPEAPDVDVCPGFPAELTASGAGTILWYDAPVGGTPLFTGSPFTTQELEQTTLFYVEVFDPATGCTSERVAVSANVIEAIPKPLARDTLVCAGDPATLSAIGSGTPGNSLLWYSVPFGGIPLETDEMPPAAHTYTTTFGLLENTTFYVAEFDVETGCESERTAIKVIVMPEVPEPVALDVEACEDEAVILTAEHGVGSNLGDFYWFDAPTDGNLLGIGQNFTVPANLLTGPGTFKFYVEERYMDCISPTREEVTVTVNALPELPTGTSATVCAGETATLTATGSAGNQLSWYSDADANNLLFTGASFETPALSQSTTFWVRQESPATGCNSALVAVTASVEAIPANPTATDIYVCNDNDAIITASGSGNPGTQLNVYENLDDVAALATSAMPPANATFDLGVLAEGTYTFYLEEENTLTGCVSARVPVTVVVQGAATPPVVQDLTICAGETATLTASSSSGMGGVYNWYSDAALTNLLFTGSAYTTQELDEGATYYVTEGSGVCESSATLVTVTVNGAAAPPVAPTPVPVCAGTAATLTATGSGGVINWYSDAEGSNLLATGGSYTTAPLAQSTTFWVGEATVGTGCVSELVAVTAEVLVGPAAPSADGVAVCEGEAIVLTASGTGTGSLLWYDQATGGTPLETDATPPANATFELGLLAVGTYTYYVAESNGSCESPRTAVTVAVTASPAAPNVQSPVAICEGENVSMTASGIGGATYNWYDTDGNLLFTGTTYLATGLTATTSFVVKAVVNGCEGAGSTVIVNVNATPEAPVPAGTTVCEGAVASLSASVAAGLSLNWYSDNAGTELLASGSTYTSPALSQTTTFWVQAFDPATTCTSALVPVVATVEAGPSAPSASNITLCAGELGQLVASGSGSGSLQWYDVATGGLPLQTDAMPPASATFTVGPFATGTYTFYVEESNGTCVSARTAVTVTVTPSPAAPIVNAPVITCAGETATMVASSPTNGTFNWYDASGTTLLFVGDTYTSGPLAATTTFLVKEELNGCESVGETVVVDVFDKPANPTVTPATICEGTAASLSATAGAGQFLNWYEDNGRENLLFTGATYLTPELAQTTTFWVEAFDPTTGCVSGLVPVTASVLDAPAPPTATGLTLCEGEVGMISASGSGTGTLSWYNVASGGAPLQTDAMPPSDASLSIGPLPAGTYTYYVEESNGDCASSRTPVTVVVTATPAPPSINAPIATCEGEEATMTANNGENGTINWYDETGTILLFTGNQYITEPLQASTVFQVTKTVNGCESDFTEVTVAVNPVPANPIVANATVCEGASTVLVATPSSVGNTINWYADASGSTLLFTGLSYTTPELNQTTIFYAQEVSGGTQCTSELVPVTVTVEAVPTAPTVDNISICQGETGTIVASGSGTGIINWYDVATGGTPIQTSGGPVANATLDVGPFPVGTYVFYVEEENESCSSSRTAVSVTVKPVPLSPVVANQTICEGATVTLTANSNSGASGTFQWYSDETATDLLFVGNQFTTPALDVTTEFYVKETVNGCESSIATVTVFVNPLPTAPTVSSTVVCEGTVATLTATAAPGLIVNWYKDEAGTNLLASGSSLETSPLFQNETYWVQALIPGTGCESELVPLNVTVAPAPSAPSAVDITVCAGEGGTLTAVGSGSGLINWYDQPTGGNLLQSDAMPPSSSTLEVGPFTSTGTFVFYVEEELNGCTSDRVPVAVIVNPVPQAPVVAGANICEGDAATLTASHGGATNGTFEWYSQGGNELLFTGISYQTPALSTTTVYQVYEVANGCRSVPSLVTVDVNEVPENPIVENVETCEGSVAELNVQNAAGNTINWYNDSDGTNQVASGADFLTSELTQTTTFWVEKVVSGTGCKSELVPVTVTVLPRPSPPSSTNITICENEVGTIVASGSGDGFLLWYQQSEGGFVLQSSPMPPANANLNVGPFVPGVYVFYVEENNGTCVSTRTPVTVTVLPKPEAPVADGATVCEGESVVLTASSSGNTNGVFNWYDATGSMLLYTGEAYETGPLNSTTSYLVRELENGCQSPSTLVTVVVNPEPDAPAAAGVTICEGETTTLTASGTPGNFLNWYDDAQGSNLLFTGSTYQTPELQQTTTFWVQEIVVGTGCGSELVPVTVTVNPQPPAPSASNIIICEGEVGEITFSGTGTANSQLSVFNVSVGGVALATFPIGPATSTVFEVGPFAAGTYTYYVQEENTGSGCTSLRTAVEVIVKPKPAEPSVDDVEICEGETATLEAPGTGTYNWYDALVDGNLLFIGLEYTTPELTEATSYYVTQVVEGCESDREEVVVTVNPLPLVPAISSNGPLCEGDSLQLSADFQPGVSYVWTGPNEYEATVQNPVIPNVNEADHQGTYVLRVIDNATGCVSLETSVFVEITPIPQTPSISSNSPVCVGENLELRASEVPGISQYFWTLPNDSVVVTSVPTLVIPAVNSANAGVYGVSAGTNGCFSGIATTEVSVIGLGTVPVVTTNSPVCEGEDILLSTDAVVGATYQWSGPDSFSSNVQNPIIEGATLANSGTYELTVVVNGCPTTSAGSAFVEVVPGPIIAGLSSNSPVCQGENIEIEAPLIPNVRYTWFNPDGDSVGGFQSLVIRNAVQSLHQGMYTLVVTDTLTGCSSSEEIRIFVDGGTGLVILADNNGPACEGEEVQFSVNVTPAQPNATFEWFGPDGSSFSTQQNPILPNVQLADSGVYTVLVNGNSGCLAGSMNSTTLEVNPGITVDAGPDFISGVQGEPIQLSATGADVYSWSPDLFLNNSSIPNPIATPPVGVQVYVLTGLSLDGCFDTDTVTIVVEPQTDELGVFDLFTPNGDGVNDTFVIQYIDNLENYTLSIYNRGGVELLNTTNYENDWDGTYRGRDLPEGTYWYVIRTEEGDEFKGAVTLIR